MSKKIFRIIITLLVASGFIIGCAQIGREVVPTIEIEADEEISEQEEVTPTGMIATEASFTILADERLKDPVSVLYEAYFPGESAVFVETDADLVATSADIGSGQRPVSHATFLPGSVLIPENETADVRSFIDFAISAEGQQVLIEAGDLPKTITIIDQTGNERVIQQPVRRIISAYGPATAIVYSVDGGERLVAASYLGARDPQGASAMERIDPRFPTLISDDYFSQQEFNLEYAATLDPDLVIAGARSGWADSVSQLGIQLFLMEAETPDQLKQAILLIGQLLGPHAYSQAQAWVAYYDWVIDNISVDINQIPQDERISVLFTGTEPLRIASGDMYQTDIIESAGGISVSADLAGYWNDVNMEQIAIWDPEVIIVPPYGGASVDAITGSSEWQILEAVQEGRVFQMPKLVVPWDTPAPDSVLGIIWMAERLNPNLIGFTCEEESVFYYNTFYNYAITGEEIAAICTVD